MKIVLSLLAVAFMAHAAPKATTLAPQTVAPQNVVVNEIKKPDKVEVTLCSFGGWTKFDDESLFSDNGNCKVKKKTIAEAYTEGWRVKEMTRLFIPRQFDPDYYTYFVLERVVSE